MEPNLKILIRNSIIFIILRRKHSLQKVNFHYFYRLFFYIIHPFNVTISYCLKGYVTNTCSTCWQYHTCCIELFLEISTKLNGCKLSNTAKNKSTAKGGKAIWTKYRVGEDGKAQRAEKHAAAQHCYKSQKEGKPAGREIWIKAERRWKHLCQRNKLGRK